MKLTAVVLSLLAGCGTAQNVGDIVVESPLHTVLEAAVTAVDAFGLLNDPSENLTLFAPDDIAFGNLITAVGEEYVDALLTPPFKNHLYCVLANHIINGTAVPSSAITGPMNATSLYGTPLSLDLVDGFVTVNGNQVTALDIMATNGVVHSISSMPILPPCVTQSIADIGAADANFSALVALANAANLLGRLGDTLEITLLAPTDDAFSALPDAMLVYLSSNATALTEVLLYHVVNGNAFVGNETSPSDGMFETLQGDNVTIGLETVNNARYLSTNILASNGVVHVIDAVLFPPSLVLPNFATAAPVTMAPVTTAPDTMAPVTSAPAMAGGPEAPSPSAPTTTAGEPSSGGGPGSGGPGSGGPGSGESGTDATEGEGSSIAEIIAGSSDHETLQIAIDAAPADFRENLGNSSQDLTLFAPDDEAFTNLATSIGGGYLSDLLTPPWSEHLVCFLKAHIVNASFAVGNITGLTNATSSGGYVVTLDVVDGAVTVDGNGVNDADIKASNGFVHSIANLPILPPCVSQSIAEQATKKPDFSTLLSLVTSAELGEALGSNSPLTLLAPTDEAFTRVPGELVEYLIRNRQHLTKVLTYHLINENVIFDKNNDTNETTYTTIEGGELTITKDTINGNGTQFLEKNILASNGVIHTIDNLMIPPSLDLPDFGTVAPTTEPPAVASPDSKAPSTLEPTEVLAPATFPPSGAVNSDTFLVSFVIASLSLLLVAL